MRWRWPNAATWAFWALVVYCALVIAKLFPSLVVLAFVASMPMSFAIWALGYGVFARWIAPAIARRRPALDVEPPPTDLTGSIPSGAFTRPIRATYPAVAFHRGQSGWVSLKLKIDRRGRLTNYQIVDQSPGRVFEQAVESGLARARVSWRAGEQASPEATTIVVFVTDAEGAPDWVRTRLAPSAA